MNLPERKYEDDLLEELFEVVGKAVPCEYLSDLKEPFIRKTVICALAGLYLSGAPWDQCAYALSYVTGETVRFDTQEKLQRYLVNGSFNGCADK